MHKIENESTARQVDKEHNNLKSKLEIVLLPLFNTSIPGFFYRHLVRNIERCLTGYPLSIGLDPSVPIIFLITN